MAAWADHLIGSRTESKSACLIASRFRSRKALESQTPRRRAYSRRKNLRVWNEKTAALRVAVFLSPRQEWTRDRWGVCSRFSQTCSSVETSACGRTFLRMKTAQKSHETPLCYGKFRPFTGQFPSPATYRVTPTDELRRATLPYLRTKMSCPQRVGIIRLRCCGKWSIKPKATASPALPESLVRWPSAS